MEYKQNREIEQINESTLIAGRDIAKHKHIARAEPGSRKEVAHAYEHSCFGVLCHL